MTGQSTSLKAHPKADRTANKTAYGKQDVQHNHFATFGSG
jgi:hypothetical protein